MFEYRRVCKLAAFLLTATLAACGPAASTEPYEPRWNFLAEGDAIAGRQAFIELQCNTCHTVAGDEFGFDASGVKGPRLGSMHAKQPMEAVAAAIVVPSHTISNRAGKWQANKESDMKDYGKLMTVRQLMDIVAYIRSVGEGGKDEQRTDSR